MRKDDDVFVIAEIGSTWYHPNKTTALHHAIQSIRDAARCGVSAVKFQLFAADTLYSKERAPEVYERIKQYELPLDWIPILKDAAHENRVEFWLSVFDVGLLDEVYQHLDGIKIASGDITNFPLLKKAAHYSKARQIPLVVSTGAAAETEVTMMLSITDKFIPYDLTVMHCVSAYPTDISKVNLRTIPRLFRNMRVQKVGFSDHTLTNDAAVLALALGASMFEKHFTINNAFSNPDEVVAVTPEDFRDYIADLYTAKEMLGVEEILIDDSERGERVWARRDTSDWLRPKKVKREYNGYNKIFINGGDV